MLTQSGWHEVPAPINHCSQSSPSMCFQGCCAFPNYIAYKDAQWQPQQHQRSKETLASGHLHRVSQHSYAAPMITVSYLALVIARMTATSISRCMGKGSTHGTSCTLAAEKVQAILLARLVLRHPRSRVRNAQPHLKQHYQPCLHLPPAEAKTEAALASWARQQAILPVDCRLMSERSKVLKVLLVLIAVVLNCLWLRRRRTGLR